MKVKLLVVISLFVLTCGALRADTIEQFTVNIPGNGGPFNGGTWVFQIQQNPTLSMPFVTWYSSPLGDEIEIDNVPAIYNGTQLENLSVEFSQYQNNDEFGCNPTWACAWEAGVGGVSPNFFAPVFDWSNQTINEGVFTSAGSSITGGGFPTVSVVPLSAVPEPTTALMLAFGLLMVLVLRRWLPLNDSGFRS